MLAGWSVENWQGHRVEVFVPDGEPSAVLLYLHPVGLELLSDNPAYSEMCQRRRWVCVAPLTMRSWWSDRLCPEFDPERTAESYLLETVLPEIAQRWPTLKRQFATFGISMGGQGAIRLGFKYPQQFRIVAGIASAFDYHDWHGQGTPIDQMYHSREACRQDTAILQIQPHRTPPHIWFVCDPGDMVWYRGNDRLHEKLAAIGIPHQCDLSTEAGGHTWEYFNAMVPRLESFLADALSRESHRLL